MLGELWNFLIFGPIHNSVIYLYAITQSLGISLVIVIFLVRLLLFPLVIKQYADMKKLTLARPRLKELQEKFKKDAQKLAAEQKKLYEEIGYNPLGCFINLFLQLPIVIALYQSILTFTQYTPANMPGLYPFVQEALSKVNQSAFDTTLLGMMIMDSPLAHVGFDNILGSLPYIILLLILGVSNFVPTYVSMKYINPQPKPEKKPNQDPNQPNFEESLASSMNTSTLYVMPIMITVSMASLPSIISVYIILQNLIGLGQQLIVKYQYDRRTENSSKKTSQ